MYLFAYGSLKERRVIARVIGRTLPEAIPALLKGYHMYETTIGYPIILPDPGADCPGVVYYSLTDQDWDRLDLYENAKQHPPAYFRRLVTVEGKHGRMSAHVYVGNLSFFRTRIKK